ncbi:MULTISPECIES: histidine kinase [Haloferax]|uniref:Histidine kinase n=1 Tax=Haloferax marinum TaxID=2666143 RepID=A0A6A8G806_9EURY|nr:MULTISPECIES: histidine kinase [Haloferax]KAB1197675.1 histidine kinase [Haloferax sp. CBA1150]MRW96728.1 histidine kinase [Haloferax marinum]
MASETVSARIESTTTQSWQAGVVAGALAAVVMGALMVVQMRPVLEVAIPSMYALTGGAAGFTIHVAHGAILGVGFAALAGVVTLDSTIKSVGVGVAYGVVLWVALAVLVMPVWLGAVGSPANPPLPNINTTSLVGHLVFGAVLGLVYPTLERTL